MRENGTFAHIINIFKDIKYGFFRLIKYQIGTKILLSIIILPIFNFLINILIHKSDRFPLVNGEIIKFGLSKEGAITLFMLFILAYIIILSEIGGLIIISNQLYLRKEESSYADIFKYCFKRFYKIFGVGSIFILIQFFLFVPLLDIGISSSFTSFVKIPDFIEDYIYNDNILIVFQYILMMIMIYFALRWIFSLHIIILENKSATKALKESGQLVKRNLKEFIKRYITFSILNGILYFIILVLWMSLVANISKNISYGSYSGKFILGGIVFFHQMGAVLLSFIYIPIQVQFTTRMYYKFAYINENKTIPSLNLKIKEKDSLLDKIFKNKKMFIEIFTIIFLFSTLLIGMITSEIIEQKYTVEVTAHRGNTKEAPENTISSIKQAIEVKSDYVEIDVRQTKDGEIIVFHDSNLKRMAKVNKNVWEMNYEDIKNIDIGMHFHKKFKGEKIPLLQEVIDVSKDKIKLNIEIKADIYSKNLVKKVVKIIEDNDIINNCVVTSLEYSDIKKVKELNPKIKTGYIMYIAKGDLTNIKSDFYSIEESIVSSNLVNEIHANGKEIHVWTVNHNWKMERLINIGVDNIITDEVEALRDTLKMREERSPYEKFIEILTSY
ncbi:glycerophosphodiester phosphodiesterase [Clostridium tetani]|uniref:glycerophosphodiester phosphodiesterase n=1 Tax=Clostridium tetani TaxID=1513 RepID=UPI0024A98EAF|nr:glycerophosphodiester phosphodiesterase [Clostridium tetani]